MKKKILLIILILILSACTKINLENVNLLTSSYPLEFISNELYGDYIKSSESIYPDDTDWTTIKLSKKQIKDFSEKDIFIYYGLYENESNTAVKLKNESRRIHIIDSSIGLSNAPEDLCYLDPTNMMMAAKNIKNELIKLQNNYIIKKKIKDNFNTLNIKLSHLDASLKEMVEKAPKKILVIDNNKLSFLSRYGLNIISLDNNINEKDIEDLRNMIEAGEVKYIYTLMYDSENKLTNDLVKRTGVKVIKLDPIITITDSKRKDKIDYFNLVNQNINEIKKELYNL